MKRQEKYIGNIATMIVGHQYYKFKIGCMEKIIIEQSAACERKFGKDVIEVKNQAGTIRRKVSDELKGPILDLPEPSCNTPGQNKI